MKLDILVAEIGSTTTVVNGFILGENASFVGAGQAPTTVEDGDVNIGLANAIIDLQKILGINSLEYNELIATSSAAGGLRMTVHGLVYDMTVKAAKEAALGAGANIHMVTAGKLRRTDLIKIKEIKPNIILLAGGVDYGERDTAIYNAELIAELELNIPIIYAGNIQNQDEIKLILANSKSKLYIVDNVYPKIDQLNVEPTRKVIQEVFEEHITHAPGMNKVREMVSGNIIPTPAGVMEATKVLYDFLGDVITIDVGGATTDIHSISEGNEELARLLIAPEPTAKRTVEGDLGVYINIGNVIEIATKKRLIKNLNITEEELDILINNVKPIPITDLEKRFIEELSTVACEVALNRHAGSQIDFFSTEGKKKLIQGKDLTAIKYIIGTGGALTKLPENVKILITTLNRNQGVKLLPNKATTILIDHNYLMASLGVLSMTHKEESILFLKQTLNLSFDTLTIDRINNSCIKKSCIKKSYISKS